jgi:hypothetical protein
MCGHDGAKKFYLCQYVNTKTGINWICQQCFSKRTYYCQRIGSPQWSGALDLDKGITLTIDGIKHKGVPL